MNRIIGDYFFLLSLAPIDRIRLRGESHIDFPRECFIMAFAGGKAITNDDLKFRKVT